MSTCGEITDSFFVISAVACLSGTLSGILVLVAPNPDH